MRADSDIKRDVEAELRWAPDVCETDIAVKVTSGVVTQQTAWAAPGVLAVKNEITVRI